MRNWLLLVLLLAGCDPQSRPQESTVVEGVKTAIEAATSTPAPQPKQDAAPTPLDKVVLAAEPLVTAPVEEVIQQLTPTELQPPPLDGAACRKVAAEIIVRWEVTSPDRYTRALSKPIYPGGISGITWGIGYDGGHNSRQLILDDWQNHPQNIRLSDTAGLKGPAAKAALPRFRDIETSYELASGVFENRSLIEYKRLSDRAFKITDEDLNANACGALVSLVYNRGGSMTGDSRKEMRQIRDVCIPEQNYECIAREIRRMCRLWKGTPNGAGLCARRDHEAKVAEKR